MTLSNACLAKPIPINHLDKPKAMLLALIVEARDGRKTFNHNSAPSPLFLHA